MYRLWVAGKTVCYYTRTISERFSDVPRLGAIAPTGRRIPSDRFTFARDNESALRLLLVLMNRAHRGKVASNICSSFSRPPIQALTQCMTQ